MIDETSVKDIKDKMKIEEEMDKTGILPYSNHELNYLYYCIETYLPEDSLTQDTVHNFVKEFDKYNTNEREKEIKVMTKDDAIVRLEAGIKLFIMNITI